MDGDVTTRDCVRGDVAVLVPAAGLGTRLGPGMPKALRTVGGQLLLVHAVRRLCRAPSVGRVVIAAPIGSADKVRSALVDAWGQAGDGGPDVAWDVVEGGATRQASVWAALAATPMAHTVVLVHDAARALAPPELVERVVAAVRSGHDAVIPVLPVTDTIKQVDDSGHVVATVDRAVLRRVQTPQGFRRAVLEAAHAAHAESARRGGGEVTDDAGLVEKIGVRVFCVPGAEEAFKITTLSDFTRVELLLGERATGWSVVPGEVVTG